MEENAVCVVLCGGGVGTGTGTVYLVPGTVYLTGTVPGFLWGCTTVHKSTYRVTYYVDYELEYRVQ